MSQLLQPRSTTTIPYLTRTTTPLNLRLSSANRHLLDQIRLGVRTAFPRSCSRSWLLLEQLPEFQRLIRSYRNSQYC